jgi:sugar transferase (PEP-CTERM/EpsH1 system associated)
VLFVCHRVPYPPKRGGKIRPFNIIRHLTAEGHQVTVASLARDEAESAEAAGLKEHCAKVLVDVIPAASAWGRMVARLPSLSPSSFGYFHSPRLRRLIGRELRSAYDMIFVHCSSVAPYVAAARGSFKVIDYGDMDSQKWREYSLHKPFPLSAGYWLEAMKLERAERGMAARFDLATCTTRAELASLRQLGVKTPSDWFPNGVDANFFSPTASDYDPDLIMFVGRMDYYPNQQAVNYLCQDVLPALWAKRPRVRFEIVGADPPPQIRGLARLSGVSVKGSVADVRPYLAKAVLTVAPLKIARGTQNKILESMAMGVPVVCSYEASGGVDAVAGEHLLVANDTGEYVTAIEAILDSRDLRQRLASAGRQRVLSHHAWASSMRQMDRLLEQGLADYRERALWA